jgi:hypothetical protein
MTGHLASRPATPIYLHLQPRSRPADPDQSSSPGHSVPAVPPLLTFLSTADYAEQQTASTPADQHVPHRALHNPVLGIRAEPEIPGGVPAGLPACARGALCGADR